MNVLPPRGPVSDKFEPDRATKIDQLTVLKEFKQRGAVCYPYNSCVICDWFYVVQGQMIFTYEWQFLFVFLKSLFLLLTLFNYNFSYIRLVVMGTKMCPVFQ